MPMHGIHIIITMAQAIGIMLAWISLLWSATDSALGEVSGNRFSVFPSPQRKMEKAAW